MFRPALMSALSYTNGPQGGRPPFDAVMMFKILVIQAANEKFLAENGFRSCIHRKKPKGKPMPERTSRANNAKSKIRSRVEHVFAEEKGHMGLFVRTVGITRATVKIGMANLVYNIKRLIFHERMAVA